MDNRIVLAVGETLGAAWDKVYGAKATIWAALGILILIAVGFGIIRFVGEHIPSESAALIVGGIVGLIAQVIQVLMQYGLYYIGIRRGADQPISYDMMFRTFTWDMIWRIGVLLLLISLIIYLPVGIIVGAFYLLSNVTVMPGLFYVGCVIGFILLFYIGIRLGMSLGFIFDGAGPWEAIKLSWLVTKDNVLPLLGITIISFVLIAISAIPLGIGLIWTLPWGVILYGVIYHRLKMNANPVVVSTPSSPN